MGGGEESPPETSTLSPWASFPLPSGLALGPSPRRLAGRRGWGPLDPARPGAARPTPRGFREGRLQGPWGWGPRKRRTPGRGRLPGPRGRGQREWNTRGGRNLGERDAPRGNPPAFSRGRYAAGEGGRPPSLARGQGGEGFPGFRGKGGHRGCPKGPSRPSPDAPGGGGGASRPGGRGRRRPSCPLAWGEAPGKGAAGGGGLPGEDPPGPRGPGAHPALFRRSMRRARASFRETGPTSRRPATGKAPKDPPWPKRAPTLRSTS